jgi:phosphoadenosine phosphosulfate reductase
MLNELTFFGERNKDDTAVRLLRFYEALALERDPRGYAVGFSGGKDSLVLKELFREAGVKHFCQYKITGLDAPELVYFIRRKFAEYESAGVPCQSIMYKRNIMRQMEAHGTPPTRIIRYCCEELKEFRTADFANCVMSFGVRKYESNNRAQKRDELEVDRNLFSFDNSEKRKQFEICYATGNGGEIRVNPLAYWTESDVWEFIRDRKLEYCSLYDEGFNRLGCVGCPMAGKKRLMEFKRFPAFERIWRKGFDMMWNRRQERAKAGLSPPLKFRSVEQWWDWWLELTPERELADSNQIVIDM